MCAFILHVKGNDENSKSFIIDQRDDCIGWLQHEPAQANFENPPKFRRGIRDLSPGERHHPPAVTHVEPPGALAGAVPGTG